MHADNPDRTFSSSRNRRFRRTPIRRRGNVTAIKRAPAERGRRRYNGQKLEFGLELTVLRDLEDFTAYLKGSLCGLAKSKEKWLMTHPSPPERLVFDRAVPVGELRHHLTTGCKECSRRDLLPKAFAAFDDQFMSDLAKLLTQLNASLDISAEKVETLARENWAEEEGEEQFEMVHLPIWSDLLSWRAVLLAQYVGRFMLEYERWHKSLENPWLDWRHQQNDQPLVKFVRGLDESEQLLPALIARNVALVLGNSTGRDLKLRLPSDGDLEQFPGLLEVERSFDALDWRDILGEPLPHISCWNLLCLARTDALWEISGGSRPVASLAEVKDLVGSTRDFQKVEIDVLNRIARRLETPDSVTAEESVSALLPHRVWESLSDEVKNLVVASEQILRAESAMPGLAVLALYHAFDSHFRQRFLKKFRDYLRTRSACDLDQKMSLQEFWLVLTDQLKFKSQALAFCEVEALDYRRMVDTIESVYRFGGAGLNATFAGAQRTRNRWLGVGTGDGGIFGTLLPRPSRPN